MGSTLRAASEMIMSQVRTFIVGSVLAVCACGGGAAGPSSPSPTPAPATAPASEAVTASYEYAVTGSPTDVVRTTTPGYLLMGGGTDVDDAMRWLIAHAGGGDILVLRATGTSAYNPYIAGLGTVNSVATLILKAREASADPFVLDKVQHAEAIFLAGGDQSNYVTMWKDTPLEDAIRAAAARGVPVGGTSAGLAVLGQFVYAALNESTVSATALANPYDGSITLDRGFLDLPMLEGLITDSHFVTRDRLGRLVTFLARLLQDGWTSNARGIGIDERTAVLVDGAGRATIAGSGAAYFLRATGKPATCEPGTPLRINDISVYRVAGTAAFDLRGWSGTGGTEYRVSAAAGTLTSTQPGGSVY
jgi:cyanophycinase